MAKYKLVLPSPSEIRCPVLDDLFRQHLVPGKNITIHKAFLNADREGYYRETTELSVIFLKVVSVTRFEYSGNFLWGSNNGKDVNAIVALPNGKAFPLFVYCPDRGQVHSRPYLTFHDTVYEELNKNRFADIPPDRDTRNNYTDVSYSIRSWQTSTQPETDKYMREIKMRQLNYRLNRLS